MDRVVKLKNKNRKYVVFPIKIKKSSEGKNKLFQSILGCGGERNLKKYQNKHLKFRSFTEIVCEN